MAAKRTVPKGMKRCAGAPGLGFPAHDAPIKDFGPNRSSKDGLYHQCREHAKVYQAHWRAKHKAEVEGTATPKPKAATKGKVVSLAKKQAAKAAADDLPFPASAPAPDMTNLDEFGYPRPAPKPSAKAKQLANEADVAKRRAKAAEDRKRQRAAAKERASA